MNKDLESVADRLKAASTDIANNEDEPDLDELRRKAHRHTGMRNVLEFSFTHLVTTIISLFATTYHRYTDTSVRQSVSKPTGES